MDKDFYQLILSNIDEGIYFVDKERTITFWNKGAENITGYSPKDVLGKHCYDNILNHIDEEGNHLCFGGCPLHHTIEDGLPRNINVFLHHKSGHRVPVSVKSVQIHENGQVLGAVEVFTDRTELLNTAKNIEQLTAIALHDQLTELPNRRYLQTFTESRLHDYNDLGIRFGMIFIDIDHFKYVNDTYGHPVGDEILKIVATTIRSALRSSDLIARNGGEEFVVVLPLSTSKELKKISEKLRVLVENSSLDIPDHTIKVTISLGASLVQETDNFSTLIERCDQLMYTSKSNGRNQTTID